MSDQLGRLQEASREIEIGGGTPFASRKELDDAAYSMLCCQSGDDDLMCLECQERLRRILATARIHFARRSGETPEKK